MLPLTRDMVDQLIKPSLTLQYSRKWISISDLWWHHGDIVQKCYFPGTIFLVDLSLTCVLNFANNNVRWAVNIFCTWKLLQNVTLFVEILFSSMLTWLRYFKGKQKQFQDNWCDKIIDSAVERCIHKMQSNLTNIISN